MADAATSRPPAERALTELGVADLVRLMLAGTYSAEEVAAAHLERIGAEDGRLCAFAHVDAEHALTQARQRDRARLAGRPTGPLHGVPVALKDVIDTRDLPTENGTVLDAGRRPAADAFVVAKLREAGAVVLGKAVTAELAGFSPGPTRNPHDPERTPGGSSSGSAAAVAAHMAPLAVGTQTNGSVVRPASFCGVVGFKPSRGLISRSGVLRQSPFLDTIGVFARSLADAALLAETIAGHDPLDPHSEFAARPRLSEQAESRPPVTPRLAFVRSPVWNQAEDDVKAGFAELVEALGPQAAEVDLPDEFGRAHALHRTVMVTDIAWNYRRYWERGADRLSDVLRGLIEEGRRVAAVDYLRAQEMVGPLEASYDGIFDAFDAVLTPAAPGEAPRGLDSTGNPAFCTIWTYLGVPALTLPLLVGSNDLPIGVQLVGRRGHDGRLLRTANWLQERLRAVAGEPVTA